MLKLVARPALIVTLSLAAAAGCAEVITYSNKSVEQGDKLLAEGRLDDAAGAYRNATQQNPRNYEAFYRLGQTYQQMGREQQALQSFKAAVDVMPAVDVHSPAPDAIAKVRTRDRLVDGLGNCVAKSASKEAELSGLMEKAQQSNRPLDWYAVARADANAGDADGALEAFDKAIAASGERGDWSIVRSKGLYLAQLGQNGPAEATLKKAYQMTPDAPKDAELNTALRKLGVVPGPSLLNPDQLHHPQLPKGPLPEIEVNVHDKNKPATPAPAQP